MDKIKSVVTGDAYDKPAKTADGAMTTQDAPDAHTVKDTSHDPNPPPMEDTKAEKMLQSADKKVEEKSNKADELKQKAEDKADNTSMGQKAQQGDLGGAAQEGKETAKQRGQEEADSRRVTDPS